MTSISKNKIVPQCVQTDVSSSAFVCCGIFPTNDCTECGHYKNENNKSKNSIPKTLLDKETLFVNGKEPNLYLTENSFFLIRKEITDEDFKTIINENEVIKIKKVDCRVIREDTRCLYIDFYDFKGKIKSIALYIDGGYYSFGAFLKTRFISIKELANF